MLAPFSISPRIKMKINDPKENRKMFDQIARSYDRANYFISLGRFKVWYRKLIKLSEVRKGDKVLDCATGTGNIPIEYKRIYGDYVDVTGVDVAEKMLEIGREKAKRAGYKIDFRIEDILNMSFADNTFDVATITFGIRNTISIDRTLKEMSRVVKPGGKVLILETGQVKGFKKLLYNFYQSFYVNQIGKILSGHNRAYEWLTDSSNDFPSGKTFLEIMDSTDSFSLTKCIPLMFGMIFLYIGEVK